MRKSRVGDRYQWTNATWEITHPYIQSYNFEYHRFVCIEYKGSAYNRGDMEEWMICTPHKYLGNFAKADNFNSLYHILNDTK